MCLRACVYVCVCVDVARLFPESLPLPSHRDSPCVEAEETHGDTNNKQTHFTHAKCDLFVVQDDEGHGGI